MDENPHPVTINSDGSSSLEGDHKKSAPVLDDKPKETDSAPKLDDSTADGELPLVSSSDDSGVHESAPDSPTSFTPSSSPTPEPPKTDDKQTDDKPKPAPQPKKSGKLSTGKLIKILIIIIVALLLIAAVIYFYLKHK